MDLADIETTTRWHVNARRNYLIGLWAGTELGLRSESLSDYVMSVMDSDFEEPGPQDVIRKLASDFRKNGRTVRETELLRRLQTVEREVRAELLCTD